MNYRIFLIDLEIGYIITEIDGIKVENINNITNILYEKKEGDSIKIKVKYINNREYKEKEIIIEF